MDINEPLRLWIDADPSGLVWTGLDCDDDLALLAALALEQRGYIRLEGLSICGGNAPLAHTWRDVELLLQHVGESGAHWKKLLVRGAGWRSMQVAWKTLRFLSYLSPDMHDSEDAVQALLSAAAEAPDASLTILTLGPPTNLANALREAPWLPRRLKQVYMMGGELTQSRLDLNFLSDRAAARTLVQSDVPTTMVPIQTCAQVTMTQQHLDDFKHKCCPRAAACALVPKMQQQVNLMPRMVNRHVQKRMATGIVNPHLMEGFIPWDLVALLAMVYPDMFDNWEYHEAEFSMCEEGEPCDGTMQLSTSLSTDEPLAHHFDIVRVPHLVRNESHLLEVTMDLLCQVPAHGAAPGLMWGFLTQVVGLLVATLVCILSLWYLRRQKGGQV